MHDVFNSLDLVIFLTFSVFSFFVLRGFAREDVIARLVDVIQDEGKFAKMALLNHAIRFVYYKCLYSWKEPGEVLVGILLQKFPETSGCGNYDLWIVGKYALLLLLCHPTDEHTSLDLTLLPLREVEIRRNNCVNVLLNLDSEFPSWGND